MLKTRAPKKVIATRGRRTDFRFAGEEHHKLVVQAAEYSGLTMNGWLIKTTLEAARRELAAMHVTRKKVS
jgi:hypothetical protein